MESFFKLIIYFQTQSEPAYYGLASLTMVLNALAIDPGRKWKGPYRWFDESMLDCCEPLEKVKAKGISFRKVVCLAHRAGAEVKAFSTNQSTITDFRTYVMACSTFDNCHVISSYNIGTFKQTGAGHFSPIGGYHAERDMALILDVARFKYPPHWVPLALLWDAMNTIDEASGQHRGFMLISRLHRAPALLYTLSCKHESWVSIAKYLVDDIPVLLNSDDVKDIYNVLSIVFTSLPSKFTEFIKWVAEVRRLEDGGQELSREEKGRLDVKEEVLKQIQGIPLYKHVNDYLSSGRSCNEDGSKDYLSGIAASICGQGAGRLVEKCESSIEFCCRQKCVNCIKTNGDHKKPVTVISGTAVNVNGEQRVDVLVPSSQSDLGDCGFGPTCCIGLHRTSSDVMTALLLALPPPTWSGIKDYKLLQEIQNLVSTDKLPTLLQEEVLHLRSQLFILKRCKDNKVKLKESRGDSEGWKFGGGNKEYPLFQKSTFCSQRIDINCMGENMTNRKGNLLFSGGFVKESFCPRIWDGTRPMISNLKSML